MYKHEMRIIIKKPGETPISIAKLKKLKINLKVVRKIRKGNGHSTTGQRSKN